MSMKDIVGKVTRVSLQALRKIVITECIVCSTLTYLQMKSKWQRKQTYLENPNGPRFVEQLS